MSASCSSCPDASATTAHVGVRNASVLCARSACTSLCCARPAASGTVTGGTLAAYLSASSTASCCFCWGSS